MNLRGPIYFLWPNEFFAGLLLLAVACSGNAQDGTSSVPHSKSPVLTLQASIQYALENNPGIAAERISHGIAAARVVIADTYPFNPVLENRIQAASGPPAAGVTNSVPLEHLFLWEVELRHQGRFRRQGAAAALSRTDWEIAFQEQTLAVQVVRAYTALLYRQEKLKLADETLNLNERLVEDVRRLVNLGKLKTTDLIVAQTEVTETLDSVFAAREAVVAGKQDLLRVLGAVDTVFDIEGALDTPAWNLDSAMMSDLAVTRRADLIGRQLAVTEADANLRLTVANRFGNPTVGMAYTYDPSRVNSIGAQINLPIPIVNTHKGEIHQSEAERAQAVLLLRQAEINVRQDVKSSLARLEIAEKRAENFRSKVLPDLRRDLERIEKLFLAGEPGVDLLQVINVRRKLLKARDSYLDALGTVRQVRADVLAATGEPVFGLLGQPLPQSRP